GTSSRRRAGGRGEPLPGSAPALLPGGPGAGGRLRGSSARPRRPGPGRVPPDRAPRPRRGRLPRARIGQVVPDTCRRRIERDGVTEDGLFVAPVAIAGDRDRTPSP